MPAAFYDFFRKIRFRPSESVTTIPNAITVDTQIEADSVTDTATIVAGQNMAFSVEDSSTGTPGQTTDTITIHGPDYQTYVPLGTTKLRLERDLGAEYSDIEFYPDPLSPILITRTGTQQITIGANSPSLPFSQEQIEDLSAALLTNGTHTELTVTYQDSVTLPSLFSQNATSGSGINAVFNLSIINNTYVASVNAPGTGYAVGNTVTIYGTQFPGGLNPANNATITVGSINGSGGILTITSVTGTPIASDNIDLAVTSTLQNVTGRGATSNAAITLSNATGSSNTSTGALKITAGGLAVFENANVGGYVKATTFESTQATGTAPFTVASTTAVANLQAATASKWHTARTVTFTGDVTGSFSIDGSADVSNVALTVGADKVALGTDTTGNYVATGAVSGNGLSGSTSSEGATFTVSSNATAVNTGETIVFRDTNGDFAARTISLQSITKTGTTGTGDIGQSGNTFGNAFIDSLSTTGIAKRGTTGTGDIGQSGNTFGTIYAASFNGPATQVTLTATNTTNASHFITFVDTATGNEDIKTDTSLTYNPNTNILTAGTFSGIISGSTISASSTLSIGTSTLETVSVNAAALSGATTLDCRSNSVFYYTSNAAANWQINFRGDGSTTMNTFLTTGQSITVVLLATQGGSAFYPTAFTIDGTASGVTVEWLGGAAPTGGNVTSVDTYSFTIIKTAASTYTVLASQARFA
jgi:hypothetical protein